MTSQDGKGRRAPADLLRIAGAGSELAQDLRRAAERVGALLGVDDAGILAAAEDGRPWPLVAGAGAVGTLQAVQAADGQGPGADVLRTGAAVVIDRLAEHAGRWPSYTARAAELGVTGVVALPLQPPAAHEPLAVVELADTAGREWGADDIAVASALVELATGCLLHALELADARRTVEQLQRALTSRVTIEQAKGMIAAERRVSVGQAFEIMRRHANNRNVTLHAIADAVVNLRLHP